MRICWKTYLLVIFCGEFCSSENHSTPKEKEVSGLQGGYIMFPVPVSQFGRIEAELPLATVFGGQVRILKSMFENRLHWDHQTGHFSLHNLTVADSGSYVIEEDTEGLVVKYNVKLTVYEQLSSPKVTLHDNSSCTWTCSVENGRNVSLSWYKENMLLNQTRNPHINTNLSLHPERLERLSSFNCVAANPIINVTFQLSSDHLQEICPASSSTDPGRKHIIYIPVLCVVCIIAVVGVVLCLRKRRNHIEAQSTNEEPQNDVQYSEILHTDLRTSQGEGQHVPELAAEGQESLLTSIYAKIQPHSPEATGTDSNVMGSGTIVLGHL